MIHNRPADSLSSGGLDVYKNDNTEWNEIKSKFFHGVNYHNLVF